MIAAMEKRPDATRPAVGNMQIDSTSGLRSLMSGSRRGPLEGMPVLHLLVVDEDDNGCAPRARRLRTGWGLRWYPRGDLRSAQSILKHRKVDLLLLDPEDPGGGGLALLEEVKTLYPETAVIVMTAFATVTSAVEAMRVGAGDYLTKPFQLESFRLCWSGPAARMQLDEESRRLRRSCAAREVRDT